MAGGGPSCRCPPVAMRGLRCGWSRRSPRPFGARALSGAVVGLLLRGCWARFVGFWSGVVGRRFVALAPPAGGWPGPAGVVLCGGWRVPVGPGVRFGSASSSVRVRGLSGTGRALRVPLSFFCTYRYRVFEVAPLPSDTPGIRSPTHEDADPNLTDGPHRRPPTTAQDNARRHRPPPAGGAWGYLPGEALGEPQTAGSARRSRSQPRRASV